MTAAAMIVLLALIQQQTPPQKPLSGQPCSGRELVGTWQLIEAQGQALKSDGGTAYKHVTPTHFIVLNVDSTGLAAYAHGGPYRCLLARTPNSSGKAWDPPLRHCEA